MPFDLQPTLKGTLLELRPLRPDDWGPLFAVASDPLIWEQHPERERYEEEVFREFFRVALESRGALVATDSRDGRIIGSSRFHGYSEEQSEIEIGWTFLARRYWGGRHNGEMKRLMLEHAFRFVGDVVFLIGPQNYRSQKAIAKVGGILVGSRVAHGRESLVYRISRDSFHTPGGAFDYHLAGRKEPPMNPAQNSDPEQVEGQRQVEELQEQSRQAFLAQDIERLRLLWSEDLVVNSPLNRVLDRSQVLDLLQRGVIRHASYEERIEATRRHGDLVIVMGHDVVTDKPGGPPVTRRFTNVWRATGGTWQMVARHANPVGQA